MGIDPAAHPTGDRPRMTPEITTSPAASVIAGVDDGGTSVHYFELLRTSSGPGRRRTPSARRSAPGPALARDSRVRLGGPVHLQGPSPVSRRVRSSREPRRG